MLVRYINLEKSNGKRTAQRDILVYNLKNGNREKIDRSLKKGLYSKVVQGETGKIDTGKGTSIKLDKNLGTKKELFYPYGPEEIKDFLVKNSRLYFRESIYSKTDDSLSFRDTGFIDLYISPHIFKKLIKDKNISIPFKDVLVSLTLDDCF